VGAGAADWKLNAATILKGDFEYQHKTERDGSGYQVLGGTALPTSTASTVDDGWRSAVGSAGPYDTFNTNARLDHTFSASWVGFVAAGLSHSLIQDNVIYAYGCYYEAECNTARHLIHSFCADGTYDITTIATLASCASMLKLRRWSPATFIQASSRKTSQAAESHSCAACSSPDSTLSRIHIRRMASCRMALSTPTLVRRTSTRRTRRCHRPATRTHLSQRTKVAGPRRLWEDSHQSSGVIQDRIHLLHRVELVAGARYDHCATTTTPRTRAVAILLNSIPSTVTDPNACAPELQDKPVWLPQFAATYSPIENLTLYFKLRRYVVSRSAGALLDRQRQPVSRAVLHATGRDRREV